ncbi:four helix bundle protein [Candidatus Woesebacteria bacterium]|nr:four helix bundle protein [Candidatus Woesebacteria bacterium]
MSIESYKELIVWQKSMDLVVHIYKMSSKFPKEELYGLTSQMRRSAVSIPSNIAEGRRRSSRNDFRHFLTIAYGSGSELETQVEIVKRLSFGDGLNFDEIDTLLLQVMKMLNRMIATLATPTS